MAIPVNKTTLVDASAAATGNATVSDADEFHVSRFYVSISAAATVDIEGSPDGGVTWFELDSLTATGVRELDRPFNDLRVSWTGNTGTLSVFLEQFYDKDTATV